MTANTHKPVSGIVAHFSPVWLLFTYAILVLYVAIADFECLIYYLHGMGWVGFRK